MGGVKATKYAQSDNLECHVGVRLSHSKEGRPEIYDFLWEHVAPLYSQAGEKKIRIFVQPGWSKAMNPVQWDYLLQKIKTDKRFHHSIEKVNVGTRSLELVVPVKELDDVLSTYNIFFDGVLPYLQFQGEKMSMDFSKAPEQNVVIHTNHAHAQRIKSYLQSSRLTKPKIQTIRFGISNPLHEALSKKRKK